MIRGEEEDVTYYDPRYPQWQPHPSQSPSAHYPTREDEYFAPSGHGSGRSRPAPPIWLPPPPQLSSDSEEDDNESQPNHHLSHHDQYYDQSERDDDLDYTPVRWGRSNFTSEEITTLDFPLKTRQSKSRSNSAIIPVKSTSTPTPCSLLLFRGFLSLLPALCFTPAAHLIDTIRTDSSLFVAIFSIFQAIFWPSLLLLGIDLFRGKGKWTPRSGSRWKFALWLGLHSILSSISLSCLLLSIQRLNISVALALSFSSGIFVTLLGSISRERRFSLEMTSFAILGYFGYIVVGIPALGTGRGSNAERLTAGIIASLLSSGAAVPSTFILGKIRPGNYDSLIATSFAFTGSLFALLLKFVVDSSPILHHFASFEFDFEPLTAAGLITLVICGTVLAILGGRLRIVHVQDGGSASGCSILKLRLLIFALSCGWEIIAQGIWHSQSHSVPSVYDIFGSVLVFLAFLLSVGYEAWSRQVGVEEEDVKFMGGFPIPFKFIPWLFSKA